MAGGGIYARVDGRVERKKVGRSADGLYTTTTSGGCKICSHPRTTDVGVEVDCTEKMEVKRTDNVGSPRPIAYAGVAHLHSLQLSYLQAQMHRPLRWDVVASVLDSYPGAPRENSYRIQVRSDSALYVFER